VFDPGQGLPMFDGKELANFIDQASWVTVNDYEGKMLSDRTGWSSADISRRVQGLVVTLGAEGCEVWIDGEKTLVPPVKATAGRGPHRLRRRLARCLLFGLEQGWSLARCAELGNRVGAIKIASRGPQNYPLASLLQPRARVTPPSTANRLAHHVVARARRQVDRHPGHVVVHANAPGRDAACHLVAVVAGVLVHLGRQRRRAQCR
jgi:hypothetical protein